MRQSKWYAFSSYLWAIIALRILILYLADSNTLKSIAAVGTCMCLLLFMFFCVEMFWFFPQFFLLISWRDTRVCGSRLWAKSYWIAVLWWDFSDPINTVCDHNVECAYLNFLVDVNGLRRFIYSIVLSMRTMLRHKCQTLFVNWTQRNPYACVCVCEQGARVCIVFFKYLLAIIQCSVLSMLCSSSVENSPNMQHNTFCALEVCWLTEHFTDSMSQYDNSKAMYFSR